MQDKDFAACYEAALRLLDFRPRSEAELKSHLLHKRKYSTAVVAQVLDRLRQARLVDDLGFAQAWVADRVKFRQKSGDVIRHELLRKGIDAEIAGRAVADINDGANALKAGVKKARLLSDTDYVEFGRRLAQYLGRRGYGGEVIHRVIPLLWDLVKREKEEK